MGLLMPVVFTILPTSVKTAVLALWLTSRDSVLGPLSLTQNAFCDTWIIVVPADVKKTPGTGPVC
jgi:hypothetical protein